MITSFEHNHYEVNCYVIVDEPTRQCAIIDPAAETATELHQLQDYIGLHGLTPTLLLLTHAHVDHVAGLRAVAEAYSLPVTMHPDGHRLLYQAPAYGSVMGFNIAPIDNLTTVDIQDGDILTLGQTLIRCLYTPGHCPGSMSYYIEADAAVITGDALFHLSIGRTDLPGGDYEQLIAALHSHILTLPDAVRVLPGHGIPSTVGKERLHNPYLQ